MIQSSKFFNLNEGAVTDELDNVVPVTFNNESAMADAFQALYENETNWNRLQEAIAIEELTYFKENGTEMIYEAVDMKGMIATAIRFIKAQWARFTGFIQQHIDKLGKWIMEDSKMAKSRKADMEKGQAKIAASDKFSLDGYLFAKTKDITKYESMLTYVKVAVDTVTTTEGEDTSLYEDIEAELGQRTGYRSRGGEFSVSDFKDYLTGQYISNIKQLCTVSHVESELSDIKTVKAHLSKIKSGAKRGYDEAIKALQNMEKSAKKETKGKENDKSAAAHKVLGAVKKLSDLDLKVIGTMLEVTGMRRKQISKISRALISAGSKKEAGAATKETKATGESAGFDVDFI